MSKDLKCPKCGALLKTLYHENVKEYYYDCECGWGRIIFKSELAERAEKAEAKLAELQDFAENYMPKYLHLNADRIDWESSFYGLRNDILQLLKGSK